MKVMWSLGCALFFLIALLIHPFFSPLWYDELGDSRFSDEHEAIRSFFLYQNPFPSQYTQKEISHMHDVRFLITIGFFLTILGFFFFSWRIYFQQTTVIMILFFIVGLFAAFFFDKSFILFHTLLFTNTDWLLPVDARLLLLYPQDFFYRSFIALGAIWLLLLGFITTLSIFEKQILSIFNE